MRLVFPDYLSVLMTMLEVNKAVKNLQSSTLRLVYPDLGNPEYLKVIVYLEEHLKVPR